MKANGLRRWAGRCTEEAAKAVENSRTLEVDSTLKLTEKPFKIYFYILLHYFCKESLINVTNKHTDGARPRFAFS